MQFRQQTVVILQDFYSLKSYKNIKNNFKVLIQREKSGLYIMKTFE